MQRRGLDRQRDTLPWRERVAAVGLEYHLRRADLRDDFGLGAGRLDHHDFGGHAPVRDVQMLGAHTQHHCLAIAAGRAGSRPAHAVGGFDYARAALAAHRAFDDVHRRRTDELRAEIKALHQRLKTTTVYVTHDQVEAMTMADRIVVMHDGRIEQIGTPLDLYDKPDNLFVAQFIGSPAMNIVNGKLRRGGGGAYIEADGGLRWPLRSTAGTDGQAVAYGIRPEHLSLADGGVSDAVPAEITVVEPTGAETELLVQAGDSQIVLVTHGRPQVKPGDRIGLSVDPAMVHVFDQATGQRLEA